MKEYFRPKEKVLGQGWNLVVMRARNIRIMMFDGWRQRTEIRRKSRRKWMKAERMRKERSWRKGFD